LTAPSTDSENAAFYIGVLDFLDYVRHVTYIKNDERGTQIVARKAWQIIKREVKWLNLFIRLLGTLRNASGKYVKM
jgi:hypothetical protein